MLKAGASSLYSSNSSFMEMTRCLAEVCREEMKIMIRDSPYIGIMVDESLDVAVTKKMVLFCKLIHNGQVKALFSANIEVKDGKADTIYNAILQFLVDVGVNVTKVSGLGTDGANVMMGKVNGVGVKLKAVNSKVIHVWCCAHRLALVAHWASNRIDFLKSVQETLVNIYFFYSFSACRYNKIKELKAVMNTQVKRFKKPSSVRWLSVFEAVDSALGAISVLHLSLDHEATGGGDGAAKASGIKKKIKNYKFVASLCLLKDVLQAITKLSKVFQSDVINIDTMTTMLSTTRQHILSFQDNDPPTLREFKDLLSDPNNVDHEYKGMPIVPYNQASRNQFETIKTKLINNLEDEFEKRFDPHNMQILMDLNTILNPKKIPRDIAGFNNHGQEALERIINHYTDLDANSLRTSFAQFKQLIVNFRDLSMEEFCLKLSADFGAIYPEFVALAQIMLTIPISSVPCERGFSLQNRIITNARNRLSVQNVENKMLIQTTVLEDNELCQKASAKFCETNRTK